MLRRGVAEEQRGKRVEFCEPEEDSVSDASSLSCLESRAGHSRRRARGFARRGTWRSTRAPSTWATPACRCRRPRRSRCGGRARCSSTAGCGRSGCGGRSSSGCCCAT